MIGDNFLIKTDSYKVSHHKLYKPGTTKIYSYLESRGGKFPETVFFGLQYILKKHFEGVQVTAEKIRQAERVWNNHFGRNDVFNKEMWEHILHAHGGKLPLHIKAVAEGTVVPVQNVLMTIENTDPLCFPLTNFAETLLMQMWYPITVASQSREMKKMILNSLNKSGDPLSIDFKLHDFGYRGVSSYETAAIGAAAHLVNFKGTDTVAGLELLAEYYDHPMAGFSIPASEHSTITSWGKENELVAYRNMLEQYPNGLIACVSDSYDIYNACEKLWGTELREMIQARDGFLVIRPDSGDPVSVISKCLDILADQFGFVVNDKGYRVINNVRLIQGDGISYETLENIINSVNIGGYSLDNIAFGSGGGLLQKVDRDTMKFAIKCSSAEIDGQVVEVFKDPVTDKGKSSKKGFLTLARDDNGNFFTTERTQTRTDYLVDVFNNGDILRHTTLDQIRKLAKL